MSPMIRQPYVYRIIEIIDLPWCPRYMGTKFSVNQRIQFRSEGVVNMRRSSIGSRNRIHCEKDMTVDMSNHIQIGKVEGGCSYSRMKWNPLYFIQQHQPTRDQQFPKTLYTNPILLMTFEIDSTLGQEFNRFRSIHVVVDREPEIELPSTNSRCEFTILVGQSDA